MSLSRFLLIIRVLLGNDHDQRSLRTVVLLQENHSSQDDDIVHVRVAITERERGLTLSRLNTAITQVRSKSVAFV